MDYVDPDDFTFADHMGRSDEELFEDIAHNYLTYEDVWEEFYDTYGDYAADYFWEWWHEFENWYKGRK